MLGVDVVWLFHHLIWDDAHCWLHSCAEAMTLQFQKFMQKFLSQSSTWLSHEGEGTHEQSQSKMTEKYWESVWRVSSTESDDFVDESPQAGVELSFKKSQQHQSFILKHQHQHVQVGFTRNLVILFRDGKSNFWNWQHYTFKRIPKVTLTPRMAQTN